MFSRFRRVADGVIGTSGFVAFVLGGALVAQAERLPWGQSGPQRTITPGAPGSSAYGDRYDRDYRADPVDRYAPPRQQDYRATRPDYRAAPYDPPPAYGQPRYGDGKGDAFRGYERGDDKRYGGYADGYGQKGAPYRSEPRYDYKPSGKLPSRRAPEGYRYGDAPYRGGYQAPAPERYAQSGNGGYRVPPPYRQRPANEGYSPGEIRDAGHRFFGKITQGLASVIEYAFQRGGRPNGYILGQEGGGAFVAGLRYGEGTLYTKYAGSRPVYWQGPSIGYDFGAEGSKTMTLVYNLTDPSDIYRNFAGVDGSAYVVGGVGITYQQNGNVVLAPIRSGIGLRLGANIGYLKYTRRPTWNPF